MYKAVGQAGSRLTRVTWMLEELSEPYELVHVLPRGPAITRLNPSGKVPVLVDGDFTLIDSAAIISYLADRHAPDTLTAPSGTRERAEIESWLFFAQTELEAAVWRKAQNKFVLPAHLRREVSDVVAYEFGIAVNALEARLGSRPYAMGERFTVADILLGHALAWSTIARLDIPSETVRDYHRRVTARPALARAREREAQAKAEAEAA